MKTILYVYHASNIGGGSYALLNVIKALDRNKYKPVVILKSNGPLVEELRSLDIDVYLLPLLNTVPYNANIFTLRNIVRIKHILQSFKHFTNLLKKINPDIVYLNTMMLHPYLKIAKDNGFKTIIHIREHWHPDEHKVQRSYAINNIRKYADQIIAINAYSASMVEDETHHPTIVYDWIDMDKRFKEMPYNDIIGEDCSDKKIYLCTGGYDAVKGTIDVVKAFSEVITSPDSRLVILGTRPKSLKQNGFKRFLKGGYKKSPAQQLDEAITKDRRIKLVPSTYFITHLYRQAYCVLSYFKIPHANLALAECVTLQTPVIAANNEEAIEYSNNGELAILFEANNFSDFKNKLQDFDRNRTALKERLSKKAQLIEQLFNPERNIKTLNEVYEKIIQ